MSHAALTGAVPATRLRQRLRRGKKASSSSVYARRRPGGPRVYAAVSAPPGGKVMFDETAKIDYGGHDRVETHGTCHMSLVTSPDGTRALNLKAENLLPQGGDLELHWACMYEGSGEWALPPEGCILPNNTNDAGDGKASRSRFEGDGGLSLTFPPGVGEDVERVIGIIVRQADGAWLHADVGDLVIPIKPPSAEGVLKALANGESGESGSLYERFCRINDKLSEAQGAGASGAAVVMANLRLSAIRQLPWYAGGCYQGKDMAHMQEVVARRVALASATAEEGLARQFFRAALATLPRGGGNGDDIRLGILQIMRENGIKEGHRPGIEDPFIAQWHQKLHSNTTVDDIYICEAYLHFLHTGNWDDFWTHLYDNHGLTREDLASMKAGWKNDTGITGPAMHLPQLINPMKHLYWILRITHGGGNMHSAMDFAKGNMPDDIQGEIFDILGNLDEWWVPTKIVEVRERLVNTWKHSGETNRDVVLLDIAMEKFYRQKVEGMDVDTMDRDGKLSVLEMAVRNVCVGGDFDRMSSALAFFQKANSASPHERWSAEWCQVMDAALDAISLAMEHHMDAFCTLAQRPADVIGGKANCDPQYLVNFGEECVRGHSMFAVSRMLSAARPEVRTGAGRSSWEVISTGSPELSIHAGVVSCVELADIQGQDLSASPTVVVSSKLGGLEDVPPGVTAVITNSPVDLLSHIAIRARQMGVLLAYTPEALKWAELVATNGSTVKIDIVGEEVVVAPSEVNAAVGAATAAAAAPKNALSLTPAANVEEWLVGPEAYAPGVVGSKASSLAALAGNATIAAAARVPGSCALPFSAFNRAVRADPSCLDKVALAAAAVAAADDVGDAYLRREALKVVRDTIVYQLQMPAELMPHLETAVASYGGACSVDSLWTAVKKVWASKWNERAFLSRKACGVKEEELNMSTLLMEVVPAELAFVLHTANPVTGDPNEVFGEVCIGLGEALVGNEPGSALSFTAAKTAGFPATVRSLPSKPVSHHPATPGVATIIARSDSNGEDLEGFAGAGLYDSVTADETESRFVDYSEEWLVWDAPRRSALMSKLAEVATAIEKEMGAPQDIEGCVIGDEIFVVQSRNQIVRV